MAWLNELPGMGAAEERTAKALSFPVGAASPLWLAFGAAASAGVAFWLATRWTRPTNLEALLGAPAKALGAVADALPEGPVATPEAVKSLEAALDPTPVIEIVLEAAETVLDPILAPVAEPDIEAEPEAAPEAVVEAVVEAAPEPIFVATPDVAPVPLADDDLTRIVGIGPKLAAALAERGVTRFAQLAAWGADELAEADAALSLKGRAVRDAWVAQARRFAQG
jgi:predicted flap endonuclease-1-like 5' DNA nuclease